MKLEKHEESGSFFHHGIFTYNTHAWWVKSWWLKSKLYFYHTNSFNFLIWLYSKVFVGLSFLEGFVATCQKRFQTLNISKLTAISPLCPHRTSTISWFWVSPKDNATRWCNKNESPRWKYTRSIVLVLKILFHFV